MKSLHALHTAELVKGYMTQAHLIMISTPSPYYWTDYKENIYYSATWYTSYGVTFSPANFSITPEIDSITLEVPNVDKAMSTLVLGTDIRGSEVRVWRVALNSSLAVIGDASLMFFGYVDAIQINRKRAEIQVYNHMIKWRTKTPRRNHAPECQWTFKHGADHVVGTDNKLYRCIREHTAHANSKPVTGGNYTDYWVEDDDETVTTGTEKVTNGTFVTNITGWTSYGTPETFERAAIGGKTGAHVVDDPASYGGFTQNITLTAGKFYIHTLNYYIVSGSIGVGIQKADISGWEWYQEFLTTGSWVGVSKIFLATVSGAAAYQMYQNYTNAATAEFYIDDISIFELDVTTWAAGSLYTPGTCRYAGTGTWCDKTPERCLALNNYVNFSGFKFIGELADKEIWWGTKQKVWTSVL